MSVPEAPLGTAGRQVPIFCSLIPRELLTIAGFEPVEIQHPEEADGSTACECRLADNLCSWARHLAKELADARSWPFVIVPASCDAMTKLHDVLAGGSSERVFKLHVPRQADPAGIGYLARQYRQLLHVLRVTEADLARARERFAATPEVELPRPLPTGLKPQVGIAGSVYPEKLVCETLRTAGAQTHVLRRCGMPLPQPLPAGLLDAGLEEFCTQLAAHYLESAVCPRMMTRRFDDFLAAEITSRRLDGLVVPVLKFCDYYHAAVGRLAERLPRGMPIQFIEGDLTTGFGEQNVTRLEAFVERIMADSPRAATVCAAGDGFVAGVDIGSTQVKAVLMTRRGTLAGTLVSPTTGRIADCSADALSRLIEQAGIGRSAVAAVGATGYGRKSLASDAVSTEIACHARGVGHFVPGPVTVIDVGGQDSKVIVTGANGRVARFTMNDKCAAGTGRFIDGIVRALALDFQGFSRLSSQAESAVPITSMCSVFAESEVVSLTARGEPLSGIARGINASIARRVAGMVRRVEGMRPFVLTGGVSQIEGFVKELERELDAPVQVFEHALYAGAIGAALQALEHSP